MEWVKEGKDRSGHLSRLLSANHLLKKEMAQEKASWSSRKMIPAVTVSKQTSACAYLGYGGKKEVLLFSKSNNTRNYTG